jgi:hypothetical protein
MAELTIDALGDGMSLIPIPGSPWTGKALSAIRSHSAGAGKNILADSATSVEEAQKALQAAVSKSLRFEAINAMATAGLLPDDAFTKKGGTPMSYKWITKDNGKWTLNLNEALRDKTDGETKNLEGWFKLIKDNLKIPIIDGTGTIVTDAVITTAFNDGIGKANSDKKAIDES